MNAIGKNPMISFFTEKPAIAPPVFVFQKDKAQKVRRCWHVFCLFVLFSSPESFHGEQLFVYIVLKLKMDNRALT